MVLVNFVIGLEKQINLVISSEKTNDLVITVVKDDLLADHLKSVVERSVFHRYWVLVVNFVIDLLHKETERTIVRDRNAFSTVVVV